MDAWLLLILSLPPQPSSIRVRVWRRLQAQGAGALQNSVYLLPFTSEDYERFPWSPPRGAAEIPTGARKGRRWVTRPRPHVDRIASAWLITRFIDPEAEFLFSPPEEFPADAIPFDA